MPLLLQKRFAKRHLSRVGPEYLNHDLKTSHEIEQFINDLNSIKVKSHFTAPQLTLWTLLAPENWEIMSIKKQEKVMEVFQLFQYNTPNSNQCKSGKEIRISNWQMIWNGHNFYNLIFLLIPKKWVVELATSSWIRISHDNSCLTYYHTLLKMGHFESENYSL